MKHVAVIGAGVAGLAALRHLTADGSMFTAVAYEQTENVGGLWVYSKESMINGDGIHHHTPMYKNLRTNLPKEIMEFPGFPYDKELSSHVMHQDVIKYLNDFANHYNLRKFIQFNTCVLHVHPVQRDSGLIWEVTTRKKSCDENDLKVEIFDAVMVCNGHFSVPNIPSYPGMNIYTGVILHSKDYCRPEDYRDKTVLCLGMGFSGLDISLDLAPHAKHVYVCSRKPPMNITFPSNISQKPEIKSLGVDFVTLVNGEELRVDVLLLCTGYKYTFPFLTPECGVTVEGERVYPLYKHIINSRLPSLMFIGLCQVSFPFPISDLQVRFALAALDGSMHMPTVKEMEDDIEEDYQERIASGMPHRHAHHLALRQWEYCDTIADIAGVERITSVTHKIFQHIIGLIKSGGKNFKDYQYVIEDSENFVAMP